MFQEITITKRVVWAIPSFSKEFAENFQTGERIESDSFEIEIGDKVVSRWIMLLYPNGNDEETSHTISLFLKLVDEDSTQISAKYKFIFIGVDEKEEDLLDETVFEASAEDLGIGYGAGILHHEEFQVGKHIVDDCFTIACDVSSKQFYYKSH